MSDQSIFNDTSILSLMYGFYDRLKRKKDKDVSDQPKWSVTLVKLIHSNADQVSSLGREPLKVNGIFMCLKSIDKLVKTPPNRTKCVP